MIRTEEAIDNDIKFEVSIGDLVSTTLYSANLLNESLLKKLGTKTFLRRKYNFVNIKYPGGDKIHHPVMALFKYARLHLPYDLSYLRKRTIARKHADNVGKYTCLMNMGRPTSGSR